MSITWVENADYHKHNGISVLKARDQIDGNFLLLMADHIFDPETARVLMEQPLGPREVILAVDSRIDRVFDLEDATKVRREGNFIVDIGKGLAHYDALDTGMFLCSPSLFDKLEPQPGMGTVRSPMACARWPGSEACVPWISATLSGKTSILRKPWRMPRSCLMAISPTSRSPRA